MIKTEIILSNLKNNGHRLTRIRKAIVAALTDGASPLAALDLKARLSDDGLDVNKTTIYRELAFLIKHGVIHEIQFGDNKARYRVCPATHHHHTICLRCNRVDDIAMKNDLEKQEKRIGRLTNFKVLHHTLEFFGICGTCNGNERKVSG